MLSIVPQPVRLETREGVFHVLADDVITTQGGGERVAERFAASLRPATGFVLPVGQNGRILFRLDLSAGLPEEGYRVSVTPETVEVVASSESGLFYGGQTVRQLLPSCIFRSAPQSGVDWTLHACEIEDAPRFSWRGGHLDVCRHFMPKEFVLKYIDLLAMHKMNVLHWHLTEDQGWRIEIKKYPKLTQLGSWRRETLVGNYGSGQYDGKPHGGFYTQDDVREVVAYAAKRFVTVVPEIEMPGHSTAALAAYPEFGNTGKKIEVATTWGVFDEVYSAEESTIRFLQDVLDEVLELFPSKFIHIGGDECPKAEWKASPRAQQLIKERGLADEEELQSWFIRQMDAYLDGKGRRLIGWDEILEGGLAPGATVMSWRGEEGGIAAARAGHDVVMTPGFATYFDHYQCNPGALEPLAIGGNTSVRKVYEYEPVPADLSAEEAKHVLGSQGQIWTEYIPTPQQVEYMAYPRMCALAEVVWSPREQRDYASFAPRLDAHLGRLKAMDVNYRPASRDSIEVGRWDAGQIGEQGSVLEWPVNGAHLAPGVFGIAVQPEADSEFEISGLELRSGAQVVASDPRTFTVKRADRNPIFMLWIQEAPHANSVLRLSIRRKGEADAAGGVFIARVDL